MDAASPPTLSPPTKSSMANPVSSSSNLNVTKRYLPSLFPPYIHPHTKPYSLQTELMNLMLSPTPGISAFPNDADLLAWTATITGPSETPYADLTFKLSFAFPSTYPLTPPVVLFLTPIYHPNIDFSGRICLDILKERWSAVCNVQSVLLSLQSLLGEPNKYV